MRFLHTSDWHLGRGLSGWSLEAEQRHAVNFIVDEAIARKVDVLIVAGDVYDLQRPAVADIQFLREVLTRLHASGIRTIITAGNHDSGPRLAATSNLLADGLHIAGLIDEVGVGIELQDEHGPVVIYPLPYLEPNESRISLVEYGAEPLARSHQAVMSAAMDRVREDLASRPAGTRAVAVAHAFVVKGTETPEEVDAERSESERDLTVGGIQTVTSDVFEGMHYVALGHLHGPRAVGTVSESGPTIRYSGSILRYSLSEEKHEKSFTIVDLNPEGAERPCDVEVVLIPQLRGMATLEGTLDELLSDKYAKHHEDYVSLTVTDELLRSHYYPPLAHKFKYILHAGPKRQAPPPPIAGSGPQPPRREKSALDVMQEFYEISAGKAAAPEVLELLAEIYESARDATAGKK